MLNEASLDQVLAWSREPGLLPRVPRGPYRGAPWTALDLESLRALAGERDPDVRFSAETEMRRRGEVVSAPPLRPPQPTLL
jgi:exodeoxyribonuclease X